MDQLTKVLAPTPGVADRLAQLEWDDIRARIAVSGWAALDPLISREEADGLVRLYAEEAWFRSTVIMARHGFGRGQYRYFRYPLPDLVGQLRSILFAQLVPLANQWQEAAGKPLFPDSHQTYLDLCHAAGQTRPTPLILRYQTGDYNCLHQDLYGELSFPLQAVVLLSDVADFEGGELILTEQRPRMQSRAQVVPLLPRGLAIIPVARRPVQGSRGIYHVNMRHGVSTVTRGLRHSLGIIFHDAS